MHVDRRAKDLDDWHSLPAPFDTAGQNRRRDRHPGFAQRRHFDPKRSERLSQAPKTSQKLLPNYVKGLRRYPRLRRIGRAVTGVVAGARMTLGYGVRRAQSCAFAASVNEVCPWWVPSAMFMPLSWNSATNAGTRRKLPCSTMESLERSPGTRKVSCQLSSAANATVGPDPVGERLQVPSMCSWALRSTSKRFLYHRVEWVVTVPLS